MPQPITKEQADAGLDLDAYFRRIGYTGQRTASLDTLKAIVLHHVMSIPFENLNPFLKWPVRLDLESLQRKLVHEGRGGYCFEQNSLLSHVLKTLGFQVTQLIARVMWNVPEGVIRPRSHMLLRIDLDKQPYIVDVGFGGSTLTGVLRLEPEIEQATPHELFRLIETGKELFVMQAKIRDEWRPLYRFNLEEQYLPDYEVSNWYTSTHPNSHFVTSLIVARPDQGRRYTLYNNELTTHHMDGKSEQQPLRDAAELRATLEENFRVTLPEAPELDTALQQLIVRAGSSED